MCYGLSTLLRAHRLPHLGPIFKVGMTSFVNPHKVVARKRIHLKLFQVHKMKVKWKVR
jgi:hypothetical protein